MSVLFTTTHPAPYMDIIYKKVQEDYDLIIYYNRVKSIEKTWKKQNNITGKIVSATSFEQKRKDIKNCSFAVIGGWGEKSNILFILLLVIFQKPFAVFSDVPNHRNITRIKTCIKKIMFRFIPFLFVTGESCKHHYMKYYGIPDKKIRVFPYGVSAPDKKKTRLVNKKRRELVEAGARINILVANRFVYRKGYKTLLEALVLLEQQKILSKFAITIAGSGEEFNEYKIKFNELSQDIKFLGWVEVDEYERLIQDTDVYIHASYFEPYGIPVVDAMMRGKLVIASDGVMSAQDFIKNGQNGVIYKSRDSHGLFQALKTCELNREKIYQYGEEALYAVNSYFSFDHLKTINSCSH